MSRPHITTLKLSHLCAALLTLLPVACAHGVEQDFADDGSSEPDTSQGGTLLIGPSDAPSAGKAPSTAGSGGSPVVSPFGGSSSSGGKAGSSAGGASGGNDGADDETAGSSGSGGSNKAGSGGAGGGSAGATGSGPCGCVKTMAWADDTVLNWGTGDCLTIGAATFKYTGTKAQTWANKQCNPTKQEPWCTDSGNDYKFMACP